MFRNRNQVVLPLEIEKVIPKNDPVFKLAEICDKLDYSRLEKEYVRAWRKLNPATMFILLVYAYMRRLYSSRQIEEACKTDIRFMWILGHEPAPDHSTIARFQNEKLVPVIEALFYQLIEYQMNLFVYVFEQLRYTNINLRYFFAFDFYQYYAGRGFFVALKHQCRILPRIWIQNIYSLRNNETACFRYAF